MNLNNGYVVLIHKMLHRLLTTLRARRLQYHVQPSAEICGMVPMCLGRRLNVRIPPSLPAQHFPYSTVPTLPPRKRGQGKILKHSEIFLAANIPSDWYQNTATANNRNMLCLQNMYYKNRKWCNFEMNVCQMQDILWSCRNEVCSFDILIILPPGYKGIPWESRNRTPIYSWCISTALFYYQKAYI